MFVRLCKLYTSYVSWYALDHLKIPQQYMCYTMYISMNSRLITIDISKQLTLDANRKAVQKISLINDLECNTDAAGNLVLVVDIYLKLQKRFCRISL